jgi:hypothetical protein
VDFELSVKVGREKGKGRKQRREKERDVKGEKFTHFVICLESHSMARGRVHRQCKRKVRLTQ